MTALIGRPINRVDGPLKVSGRATYAAEQIVGKVENVRGVVNDLGVTTHSSMTQRSSDTLTTGKVTADPFQHSADAIRLLRLRRHQLLRQSGDMAPARQLLRRLVPDPSR